MHAFVLVLTACFPVGDDLIHRGRVMIGVFGTLLLPVFRSDW